jgi:integrase
MTVYLTAPAMQVLDQREAARNGSPFVFANDSARGHITDAKHAWARIRKRAGIGDVRIHDLRRTLATAMLNAGTDMKVVSAVMGHASMRITEQHYAMLADEPKREAMKIGASVLIEAATKPAKTARKGRT